MQKKFIFAKTVKLFFLILFVWFSYKSASDYVNGKIVYDVINELDTNLVFPSVTLCPKQKGQSAFMNIEELGRDYPSKDPNVPVDGFSVYFAIGQQYPGISFDIVKNYSFKLNDLKIESSMITPRFISYNNKFVSPEEYKKENKKFSATLKPNIHYQNMSEMPISYQETLDIRGRCFNFQTSELATLDTEYEGKFL